MAKSCGYKRSEVWLYVQNRMSRKEETAFQQHLLHCMDCRDELVRLRLMIHSIGKRERRILSLRAWMVAASITCIVVGGGVYWHHLAIQEGSNFSPAGAHELKTNPPVLHNDKDSIAPQDTIPTDSINFVAL